MENSTAQQCVSVWTYSTTLTLQNTKKNPDLETRSEYFSYTLTDDEANALVREGDGS